MIGGRIAMSKQILQMKYHPAMKEVKFQRFQTGEKIPIKKASKLIPYMNKRGKFVLQDHGNPFLADIAYTFDGESVATLEVITTKRDWEDFEQMVEYYNAGNPKVKIDATLLAELPDMKAAYEMVKNHGNESIKILEEHKNKFFEVPMNNDDVKGCVNIFAADVQKEIDNINARKEALADNNVNLCFAGAFSSGKSMLINSLLGYAVLPESIKSETACMFRIKSPKTADGDKVRIRFVYGKDDVQIEWNEKKGVLEFAAGPNESEIRQSIQEKINENRSSQCHKQVCEVLGVLNDDEYLDEVDVFFPIPFDNDKTQFTIYDTPGTDSNYANHDIVLKDALSVQANSILVFVIAPDRLEGEGNHALLNHLKEQKEGDGDTCIDLDRSLFVMNKIDANNDPKVCGELKASEITDKEDPDFSINLADRKLFFVSAKIAYASRAVKNEIQTDVEEFIVNNNKSVNDLKFGRYFQHNHCGTSDIATNKLIEASRRKLNEIDQAAENDDLEMLYVCSGLYALESEIIVYGEKYAEAVKTYAIIDSVNNALKRMRSNASGLEAENRKNLKSVEEEIAALRSSVAESINEAYKKFPIDEHAEVPEDILVELHLDVEYLYNVLVGKPLSKIDQILKGLLWGLLGIKYKENDRKIVEEEIRRVCNGFIKEFLEKRQMVLEEQRDSFLEEIEKIIREKGGMSEDAERVLFNIRKPDIERPTDIAKAGNIYDAHKYTKKFFLFKNRDYIDKESFMREIESLLADIQNEIVRSFVEDYRNALKSVLSSVETEYNNNLVKYSLVLKGKLNDKEALECLRERLVNAANELAAKHEELEKLIWEAKDDR
jgi:GTPase SAR1 family protein